ncbi:Crp/Fnr family transcriptional regulator [Paramagnetospirillum kuznetsovii]|uniref:Crp/Fnr family transcriptional regulator n=1 Tax=Paramagnetospirillum kuznetsovii TaxID=2053833 RepID=A0A364P2B9_9PROT|nr:Crp/Fnr family transcriptional regulator [Paramagnetospirillum kuznetsovii]RAU23400.1 Crp/Fnr family transcriptional regulator [Paramagnetospirillum kuznetsovii]
MSSDALSALKRNQLFAPIPSLDLARLLDGHEERVFADGAELFREGEPARHLFLILRGAVRLNPSAASSAKPLALPLAPGDTVGEEAVLAGMPYCVTAAAMGPTTVAAISADALMRHLESHFDSAIAMISAMAAHLRERVREITELKMQSTAERLANYLLMLAGPANGQIVVRLPFEKRHLADHLGMDPATLSRAFAKLRDKGVVASRTDKVEIADVGRLRNYGNGSAITH